jgi:hypothetical protein
MIVCPNCEHRNPDGAMQCEACYTPLPTMTQCPNCGSHNQSDAIFCGHCGFNLRPDEAITPIALDPIAELDPVEIPPLPLPVVPEPMSTEAATFGLHTSSAPPAATERPIAVTQLQRSTAKLVHVPSDATIELPPGLSLMHIGKANDRIPPDIDLSGYPNSEIVSRVHADIRIEADAYYIEDVGSSNGTYVNNAPLAVGSRYRLRSGDRISFGKGDKVAFLFQI